jgi:L-galactose dehydrogenase
MEFRELGNTGLRLSVIGYGAASLGGAQGAIDESVGIRSVRESFDRGVNFVDVSPYYGVTVAETVLGKALAGVDRSSYILATKVGRYDMAEFDFSAERVRRSVDESLQRLGVDHIDLIQCHDIEFGSLDQIVEETVPALRELVQTGKVRFVGVTGYPLTSLGNVISRVPVDSVLTYCRYNLQDRSLLPWLPVFAEQGVGVINASVLSMGLLTERGAPPWHPATARLREAGRQAAQLCKQRGSDIAKLGIQFALARPEFASTLIGSADPDNMARNIAWALEPIDLELLAEVELLLAPVRDVTWPSGRPENGDPVVS